MEAPQTLSDYFDVVDNFLSKTFRDDSKFFLAVKTLQVASTIQKKEGDDKAKKDGGALCSIKFSPRLALRNDGSSFGKAKIGCLVNIPDVCEVYQRFFVNNEGHVGLKLDVNELYPGLTLAGALGINTFAGGTDDTLSASLTYTRSDWFGRAEITKAALGAVTNAFDAGVKFGRNIMVGVMYENQAEEGEFLRSGYTHHLSMGAGCHGTEWSLGAKIDRNDDVWTGACLAFYQRLAVASSVACNYFLDLQARRATLTMGVAQRFMLPLQWLSGQAKQYPFIGCLKGDSDGDLSVLVRGHLNGGQLKWGLLARSNVFHGNNMWRYGVTLSVESQ